MQSVPLKLNPNANLHVGGHRLISVSSAKYLVLDIDGGVSHCIHFERWQQGIIWYWNDQANVFNDPTYTPNTVYKFKYIFIFTCYKKLEEIVLSRVEQFK